jgi:hypothetical protein
VEAAVYGFVFLVVVLRAFERSGCLVEEYYVTAHKEGRVLEQCLLLEEC